MYPIRLGVYNISLRFKGTSEEIASLDRLVSQTNLNVCFLFCGNYIDALMYPSDRAITDNGMTAELSLSFIEK